MVGKQGALPPSEGKLEPACLPSQSRQGLGPCLLVTLGQGAPIWAAGGGWLIGTQQDCQSWWGRRTPRFLPHGAVCAELCFGGQIIFFHIYECGMGMTPCHSPHVDKGLLCLVGSWAQATHWTLHPISGAGMTDPGNSSWWSVLVRGFLLGHGEACLVVGKGTSGKKMFGAFEQGSQVAEVG